MNDEIKEILECLEKYGQLTPDAIDDLHYIRDYITNLQETIDFQDKWLEYYKDFIAENNIKDYKSRIEKAVEYLETKIDSSKAGKWELLKILNGRSVE